MASRGASTVQISVEVAAGGIGRPESPTPPRVGLTFVIAPPRMSDFVVSARKYRPQRFDEVVGQEHVSQTLKNALRQDRLAHAFLFCGPRGVGKTTNARILAKVLNCLAVGDDYEPCNACDNCAAFNRSASFNIFELDGASNNKVDHMHQLMEQVRVPPQAGRKKVYIIDEVHMLSQAAFNAFLKTLEEPPDYAIFILATTEKHKILPTILSRCQVYDFHRIKPAAMADHLQAICTEEGVAAEPEALHLIAEKADGALRDALSIFDRVVSSRVGGDEVRLSYAHAAEQLNVLDHATFFAVTDALLAEDAAGLYVLFDGVLGAGFEPEPFLTGLARHLRQLFVCKSPRTIGLIEVSDALRTRYAQQAAKCSPAFLVNALNLAAECDFRLRQAANKRLHVELYLVKMAYAQRTVQRDAVSVPAGGIAEAAAALPQKKRAEPLAAAPVAQPTLPPEPRPSPTELREPTPEAAAPTSAVGDDCVPAETAPTPEAASAEPPPPAAAPPTEPVVEVPAAAEATPTQPANGSPGKAISVGPSISFEDEEDDDEDDVLPASSLTVDRLRDAWLRSAAEQTQRIQSVMQRAELTFDCPRLIVKVGSQLALNTLRNEATGIRDIKSDLRCPELEIAYGLDEALAPKEAPKAKVFTAREKWEGLMEVNPAVDVLRKRMGLKYEE